MENEAGQGSDFIEIVSSENSAAYNIIYYNSSEIAAGDWVALCETYTGGCEDAVIYQVSYFNSENGPYAFLYTKDKDGNTFIPTNGDKYKFMTETQFDAYCDSSSLYSPMCDGYAAAYFTQQCTANPLYNSCLLYTSPSPRDRTRSRMPSSA